MNLILMAHPLPHEGPKAIAHAADTAAMDLFVIATLCILFFLLGCFATVAWQIWRRSTRPEPHIQLLMELEHADEEALLQSTSDDPSPATHYPERDPDWWKQ